MVAEADRHDGGNRLRVFEIFARDCLLRQFARPVALFQRNLPPEEAIYQACVLRFRLIT
jgi:hypothetical protein